MAARSKQSLSVDHPSEWTLWLGHHKLSVGTLSGDTTRYDCSRHNQITVLARLCRLDALA